MRGKGGRVNGDSSKRRFPPVVASTTCRSKTELDCLYSVLRTHRITDGWLRSFAADSMVFSLGRKKRSSIGLSRGNDDEEREPRSTVAPTQQSLSNAWLAICGLHMLANASGERLGMFWWI